MKPPPPVSFAGCCPAGLRLCTMTERLDLDGRRAAA